MQNLAGDKNCDAVIVRELTRAGIRVVRGRRRNAEVPASITGKLGPFTFVRAWYYWCVAGPMLIAIARELYADPVGKEDIRVAGHCGRPSPDEGWAVWETDDGRIVLPASEEADVQRQLASGLLEQSDLDKFLFSDDPASLGARGYVRSYHIDSELGLYKFAEAIRRHGLV